jgi:DNA-binding transcriptional LysR family regulator
MKRDCPTIQELMAFDAVARYGSITQAAEVLCITVSAVSKQLAGLERFVERPLLQKSGRSVQLTPQGQMYWQKISGSLRAIEAATFELRSQVSGAGILTLASVPTFLTKWLIPRLPSFRQQFPGVTLSFYQHLAVNESIPASVDVAIRYGSGEWPGVLSDYIAGREFVPVCSPALFGGVHRPILPIDLVGHALLHHREAPSAWHQWAVKHGVTDLHDQSGPRFAQYSSVIQAAVSGLGISLVPQCLVQDELKQGTLISPCGDSVTIDQGHYLCYRPDRQNSHLLASFRSWILDKRRQI